MKVSESERMREFWRLHKEGVPTSFELSTPGQVRESISPCTLDGNKCFVKKTLVKSNASWGGLEIIVSPTRRGRHKKQMRQQGLLAKQNGSRQSRNGVSSDEI